MSMQIKAIYLYNKDGEIRELKFKLGKVNIISGKSDTGKSAIISILSRSRKRERRMAKNGISQIE